MVDACVVAFEIVFMSIAPTAKSIFSRMAEACCTIFIRKANRAAVIVSKQGIDRKHIMIHSII